MFLSKAELPPVAMWEAWPSQPSSKLTWPLCACRSPAYGGRLCSGPEFQYQICNSEECPGPYEDFRAQQCAKRNSYYVHQNAKHSWLPYEPEDGEWAPPPPSRHVLGRPLGLCLPGWASHAWGSP